MTKKDKIRKEIRVLDVSDEFMEKVDELREPEMRSRGKQMKYMAEKYLELTKQPLKKKK